MRTLAVIRQTRQIEPALTSIHAMLRYSNLDALWLRHSDDPEAFRYEDSFKRLQAAREAFLAGPWDAMLIVDDDLIVPKYAYELLREAEMPVAMGLTVRRTKPHLWSAVIDANGIEDYITLDMKAELARKWWGDTFPVRGCGHNPTLIERNVIERIPFRREDGIHGADRFFAMDCYEDGVGMVCVSSVVVDHWFREGFAVRPVIIDGAPREQYVRIP